MIKSMTGFGVATIDKPSENINLEIKSLTLETWIYDFLV